MKTNIPVISFIIRAKWLILITLLFNWIDQTRHTFWFLGIWKYDEPKGIWFWEKHTPLDHFGAVVHAISFAGVILLLSLFLIHLYFRDTIDKDAHDGKYIKDWGELTAAERVLNSTIVRIGIIIALCILSAQFAKGDEPDQVRQWRDAKINPKWSMALDMAVFSYKKHEARYQKIQEMRPNGVPANILFCLHYRESDNDFTAHAHEGSPLRNRTRDEPKGRLPWPAMPPFTFEQSAEDAYYVFEHPTLDKINWKDKQSALSKMESFNGYGYRKRGVASPYLWSGTSLYKSGKYVADGRFDRLAIDHQLGCAAILKAMQAKGIAVAFD